MWTFEAAPLPRPRPDPTPPRPRPRSAALWVSCIECIVGCCPEYSVDLITAVPGISIIPNCWGILMYCCRLNRWGRGIPDWEWGICWYWIPWCKCCWGIICGITCCCICCCCTYSDADCCICTLACFCVFPPRPPRVPFAVFWKSYLTQKASNSYLWNSTARGFLWGNFRKIGKNWTEASLARRIHDQTLQLVHSSAARSLIIGFSFSLKLKAHRGCCCSNRIHLMVVLLHLKQFSLKELSY